MSSDFPKIGLAPFCNWYQSGCSDLWSSPSFFEKTQSKFIQPNNDYFREKISGLFAYGAKNCVIFCQLHGSVLRYTFTLKVFESIHEKVNSVSFARCLQAPKLFIGSNQGNAALFHLESNVIQKADPSKLSALDKKFDRSITSSDWAHNVDVFYAIDNFVIQWNTLSNAFETVDLQSPRGSKEKIELIRLNRVDPLLIAVAWPDSQIGIYKFDGLSIKTCLLIQTIHHGKTDICSMDFPYECGDYPKGILAAINRNGDVSIYNVDTNESLFKYSLRTRNDGPSTKNFYSVAFIPRRGAIDADDQNSTLGDAEPEPQLEVKLDLDMTNDLEIIDVDQRDSDGMADVVDVEIDGDSDAGEGTGVEIINTESPAELVEKEVTRKIKERAAPSMEKFKILVSKCDGKLVLIEVPLNVNSGKCTISGNLKGKSHNSVIFNISVINPYHYTSQGSIRTIQPFWELKPLAVTTSIDRQIICHDLKTLRGRFPPFPTICHQIHDIEFNPVDISQLTIAAGDGVKFWKFKHATKEGPSSYQVESLPKTIPSSAKVYCIAWHPLNRPGEELLALGTKTGEFYCIDMAKSISVYSDVPKNSRTLKYRVYSIKWGHIPSQFSGDLTREWACYTVYSSGVVMAHVPTDNRSFDLDTLSEGTLKRAQIKKTDCVWKDDFNYLAVGYDDGQVYVCINDGYLKPVAVIEVHSLLVSCIRWHPDNVVNYGGTRQNVLTFKERSKFEYWIATCSNDFTVQVIDLSETVKQYHADENHQVIQVKNSTHSFVGHTDRVMSLAWSRTGEHLLASCSADTTVQIWNVNLGINLYNYRGHWSRVFTVTWAPWDDDLLFSAGDDNSLQAWSPSDLRNFLPPDDNRTTWSVPVTIDPLPVPNQLIKRREVFDQLLDPVLEGSACHDFESSGESEELPRTKYICNALEQLSKETIETTSSSSKTSPSDGSVRITSSDDGSQTNLPTISESASSQSASRTSSHSVLSRLRNPGKYLAEFTNTKEKKRALLPLSNVTENCSTKLQSLRDVEFLISKLYPSASGMPDDPEARSRNLLFLGQDELNELCTKEMSNHRQNKHFNHAHQISFMQGHLKETILAAARSSQLTEWMVSMSASISREFWSQVVLMYALQLEKSGEPVQSAIYYSIIFHMYDALRVLTAAGLYKEALLLIKSREPWKSDVISDLLRDWAKAKEKEKNYEVAAKIHLVNNKPGEAARCLAQRTDDPKCQQLSKALKAVAKSSETDPPPLP